MENNFNGVHPQCAVHLDAETEFNKASQKFYFGEKHSYTNLFHEIWFVVMHRLLSGDIRLGTLSPGTRIYTNKL